MKNLQMYIFHICRFNKGEDKYFFIFCIIIGGGSNDKSIR